MIFSGKLTVPTRPHISHNSIDFLLDRLGDIFDSLQVVSTAGDIRPPYYYQWIAKTKLFDGWDDPIEGVGGTPYQAVRNLYKNVKEFIENPEVDE